MPSLFAALLSLEALVAGPPIPPAMEPPSLMAGESQLEAASLWAAQFEPLNRASMASKGLRLALLGLSPRPTHDLLSSLVASFDGVPVPVFDPFQLQITVEVRGTF